MNPADAPNINYFWTTLMVEELVRNGVDQFIICPGSRSTPLTLAVADHPVAYSTIHYDERGAAFYALGMAKVTREPVALICTSGSAVANYLPAVMEASQSNVPLLLLTADRPPELLQCGANQAIDQQQIFGNYVRWYTELPCPTPEIDPAYVLTTMDQAVYRSKAPQPGPVHVNCHFREPLAPKEVAYEVKSTQHQERWFESNQAYSFDGQDSGAVDQSIDDSLGTLIRNAKKGLLLLGPYSSEYEANIGHELSVSLGWPVWKDVCHDVVNPDGSEISYGPYHNVLIKSPYFKDYIKPDVVVHVGGPLVSKPVLDFMHEIRPTYIHFSTYADRQDPMHLVTHSVKAPQERYFLMPGNAFPEPYETPEPNPLWRKLEATISDVIDTHCTQDTLSEISVARAISKMCPERSSLYLGNSMPVRDVDMFGDPNCKAYKILANRGASGIDGNIASALGAAATTDGCTTLLLGDLAALHDLNSLALAKNLEDPFVMVVINNDGGGIFSFLPVADKTDQFEACFGTPHGMQFEHAATQFGLKYERPATMTAFREAYATASTTKGATLIEVCTDRAANKAEHEQVQQAMIDAAEKFLKENP